MAGKADIVATVADQVEGLSKKQAAEAFDAIFSAITAQLAKGDRVSITGFGSFSVTERAAREGRNPATGAAIKIPASRVPKFKAGKELKEAVNG